MTWNVYEVAADHEFRIGDKNVAYFRVLSTGRRGEDKARATLAAAAPEMLNALEDMLELHTAHHNNPVHANARAIILGWLE
jgi:uncharacterized membrane protein YcjF (UPF0283 family)